MRNTGVVPVLDDEALASLLSTEGVFLTFWRTHIFVFYRLIYIIIPNLKLSKI